MTEKSERAWRNAEAEYIEAEPGYKVKGWYMLPSKREVVQITTNPITITVLTTVKNNNGRDVEFFVGWENIPWASTLEYVSHPIFTYENDQLKGVPVETWKGRLIPSPEPDSRGNTYFAFNGFTLRSGERANLMYTIKLNELGYSDWGETKWTYPYSIWYKTKDDVFFRLNRYYNDTAQWVGGREGEVGKYTYPNLPVGPGSWVYDEYNAVHLGLTRQMLVEGYNSHIDPYSKYGLPKLRVKIKSFMYHPDLKWYYPISLSMPEPISCIFPRIYHQQLFPRVSRKTPIPRIKCIFKS